MAISRRIRFEILRRDDYACRYCGAKAPDAKLTVDHVVPVALGGNDDPTNLVTACSECNSGKTSTSPEEQLVADVNEDALRWAQAMRQAAAIVSAQVAERGQSADSFLDLWVAELPQWAELPAGWDVRITGLLDQGLPWNVIEYAVSAAAGASHVPQRARFRYFIGVCNRRAAEIQALARTIIDTEGGS